MLLRCLGAALTFSRIFTPITTVDWSRAGRQASCTAAQLLLPLLSSVSECPRLSCACCRLTVSALSMAGRSQPFARTTVLAVLCFNSSTWVLHWAQDIFILVTCVTILQWRLTRRSSAAGSQTSFTSTRPTRARSEYRGHGTMHVAQHACGST